jgi:Spy/CpxP family protein refolding chaperone
MTATTRRLGRVATVLLASVAVTACGGAAPNHPPATASSSVHPDEDDDATAGLMEHHRHHHHGGVTLFIAMSLDTLGVSPEQQAAVEKIRTDLHARMEPARMAEQNLVIALADGIAAGTIDAGKVDTAVQQLAAAAATVHDASADALNQLHDVLTPPQRAALVDKVRAHWAVWQKANAEEAAGTKPEGGRLATLTTDLGLTPDQVTQMRAALADPTKAVPGLDLQDIDSHLTTFGSAFVADKFDARTLTTASGANAHLVGWGGAHMAHFVEAVGPFLTPEQRIKLAQHLREHASHTLTAEARP